MTEQEELEIEEVSEGSKGENTSTTNGNLNAIELKSNNWNTDFSLYMQFNEGTSHKDYLYELQTDDIRARMEGRQDEKRWNVFVSYGRVTKTFSARKRKLKASNLSWKEAIAWIRKDVLKSRAKYTVLRSPDWWEPLPTPELQQINVMLAKSARKPNELTKMEAAYEDDNYVAELKLDGHRAKAHFWSHSLNQGKIRFDSRETSKTTGHFVENTDSLSLISSNISLKFREFVHKFHGTIVDGEVTHPEGLYAVQSIMGAKMGKALQFQREHGPAVFTIFDLIHLRGKDVSQYSWEKRRKALEQLHAQWTESMEDTRRAELIQLSPVYYGANKTMIREWAAQNGYEGTILKRRDSKYVYSGRGWDWIKDKPMMRLSCFIIGYEDSEAPAYAPKGWIKSIALGQFNEDGEIVKVGTTSGMSEQVRQYISENRKRCLNSVVDIQCQEQLESFKLRHPQFVCFREDVSIKSCTTTQER